MNKHRLEQMVMMLRALPPEKREEFSLSDWKCETTACAVGHACLDPVFQEQGLVFSTTWATPTFGRHESWAAVENFFDLNIKQSEWLFSDWTYPKNHDTEPREVANRIAQFIESDGSSMQMPEDIGGPPPPQSAPKTQ
jgi:hypothetical protein